jgi:hypothetical protein
VSVVEISKRSEPERQNREPHEPQYTVAQCAREECTRKDQCCTRSGRPFPCFEFRGLHQNGAQ